MLIGGYVVALFGVKVTSRFENWPAINADFAPVGKFIDFTIVILSRLT
jgi:hypothetical protein